MSKKIGLECKLYLDPTPLSDGPVGGSWAEVTLARDVNLNLSAGEADVTARDNAGWKSAKQTLREASIEFEMSWDPTDAQLEAIRDAYLNGTGIAMAVMDGDITTAGNEGFVANVEIMAFNRSEPLEEGVTVSITAKPYEKQQWYEVA